MGDLTVRSGRTAVGDREVSQGPGPPVNAQHLLTILLSRYYGLRRNTGEMSESARQILVVDGDAPTRREVKSACEQDGYHVLEAESGSEALRVHTAARP